MFNSARIKLTLWYLLIIMVVSGSFSTVLFRLQVSELNRFAQSQRVLIERRLQEKGSPFLVVFDHELLTEARQRLLHRLFFINAGIFLIAGGLGYFLAGKTLEPIQDMVENQKRFITDSSHELRTPLASLKSSLEVHLRDPKLKLTEAKQLLADNLDDVNRLQTLTDRLLQLASHQLPSSATLAVHSLTDITTRALMQVKGQLKQKKISVSTQIEMVQLTTNDQLLTETLVILLENAIKYSPTQSTIQLTTHRTQRKMNILITDQGVGIDAKDIPHIFDRFYRSDQARSSQSHNGYGLGLAIARQNAQVLNGSLSVKSQVNEGSTFTLTLPLK